MAFRLAPEGQPTASIETMLSNAEQELRNWRYTHKLNVARAESSGKSVATYENYVAEFKWQLEQRKATEVNGL